MGIEHLVGAAIALGAGSQFRRRGLGAVLLIGFFAAVGGGILRDLLLGLPLWVLDHPLYPLVAILAAYGSWRVPLPPLLALTLDFAGSLLFGIWGAERAARAGWGLETAALAGLITAMGGGFLGYSLLLALEKGGESQNGNGLSRSESGKEG